MTVEERLKEVDDLTGEALCLCHEDNASLDALIRAVMLLADAVREVRRIN